MQIEWNLTLLAAAGVGLLIGLAVGLLARGRSGSAERARAEQLEGELEQTREELESHRDDVARHFAETSDLFRDVTEQYTRLYAHLASGARSFSVDDVPAIGDLEKPLIGGTAAQAATEAASAPADPEQATLDHPAHDAAEGDASAAAGADSTPADGTSETAEPAVKTNGGTAPAPPTA